jgi:hypothetical protein
MSMSVPVRSLYVQLYRAFPQRIVEPDAGVTKIRACIGVELTGRKDLQFLTRFRDEMGLIKIKISPDKL